MDGNAHTQEIMAQDSSVEQSVLLQSPQSVVAISITAVKGQPRDLLLL
jgi:uncharacterized protein (DUF1786 family)